MSDWKEYRLGEVINILDYKRVPLSSKERSTRKGCYPYYGAQGIIDYIDDYIFDGTYLLIAEDGENLKSQKQNIAQLATGKYWVNNHAHIVESNGLCDIRYLCYLLNTMDVSGYITGSAQPKLNQANMSSICLNLPPVSIQKRIADFLSRIDDKIEYNRRINENLEQQAQALFKSWFVDFEPFKDQPFVESELGMIPQGWKVGTFLDNIKVMPGGTPSTNVEEYWKDGVIPFFSPKDVNGVYCFETEKKITEEGLNNCSSRLYPKDTLFITARGTVGKLTLAGVSMAMNQSNYALVANEGIGKYYLYLLAQTLVKVLLKKANGAVFSAITTRDFDEPTIMPSTSAITQFENIISPIFDRIHKICIESRRLAELRDTLLPKLMSGEINVNNL